MIPRAYIDEWRDRAPWSQDVWVEQDLVISRAIVALYRFDEITERLMLRMVNEALFAVGEQIAQRESDVDVATVLGMGFPDFRGGILKYARDIGIDTVAGRLDALAEQFGERFRACDLLQEMKGS